MGSSFCIMATNPADALLQEFAECSDPTRSECLLESLVVEHALPGVRKIVRYKLAFQGAVEAQDVDDVASEVVVELIARLRGMKDQSAETIGAFSGYTAVAAYHACNEYLRRKYPNRHRLKTRLRYLFTNEKSLAIWEDGEAEWLCGLLEWHGGNAVRKEKLDQWRDLLHDIPRGRSASHPADMAVTVLGRLGAPVPFDDLVGIFAVLWGVEDLAPAPETAAREVGTGDGDPGER
jgi:hypothetical protein